MAREPPRWRGSWSLFSKRREGAKGDLAALPSLQQAIDSIAFSILEWQSERMRGKGYRLYQGEL